MPMKKQDIEGCRRVLEAKKGELLSGRHKAEGITVERVPDSIEELTMEMERSMAVDALNRNAALLGQVTEALARIGAGNYGVCMACEHAISLKRLAALPWAALCLDCQQVAESRPSAHAMTGTDARMQLTL
jgi:RNA polymerase-binding transcription factor